MKKGHCKGTKKSGKNPESCCNTKGGGKGSGKNKKY